MMKKRKVKVMRKKKEKIRLVEGNINEDMNMEWNGLVVEKFLLFCLVI